MPHAAIHERLLTAGTAVALALAGSAAAAALPGGAPAAHAATSEARLAGDDHHTVTVTGTGRVSGTPDLATVDLGVEARGETVEAALAGVAEAMTRVRDALVAGGVAPSDLRTTNLSVRRHYEQVEGSQVPSGFEASQSLTVTVRDLERAGAVVSDAVAAGGDAARVDGVSLRIEDTGALRAAARDLAFADAKTIAEGYARAAGRRLGEVVRITEHSTDPAPVELSSAAPRAGKDIPIEPGTSEVSATVQVVFALD